MKEKSEKNLSRTISKRTIHAPRFLNEADEYGSAFSRGLRLDLGPYTFVSISGTASIDRCGRTYGPGDFLKQVQRTYENLSALLSNAGVTWRDVIKTRCYLKNMKYYKKFNQYRSCFYEKLKLTPFPASVCVQAVLCRPELLVEIEVEVVCKRTR